VVLRDGKGPYGIITDSVQACFEIRYGREIHSESNRCKFTLLWPCISTSKCTQ